MIKRANSIPKMVSSLGPTDVALLPNTGIQFIDVALTLSQQGLEAWQTSQGWDAWYEERNPGSAFALRRARRGAEDGRARFEKDRTTFAIPEGDPNLYDFSAEDALKPFLGKWVPLPFQEVQAAGEPGRRRLAPGPEDWARIRIVKLAKGAPDGETHRAVLAFDTATQPAGGAYLSPRDGRSGDFVLGCTLEEVSWLLDPAREAPWLSNCIARLHAQGTPQDEDEAPRGQGVLKHLATYLTFLQVLQASGAFSRVRMLRLAEQQQRYVDVDLVLDLGNSRSCGFLIEQVPGQPPSIANAYRLQLRDLSRPEEVWDLPFESRVEFAKPAFGEEEWSEESGRFDAFEWPSPVRIGPEAVRLSSLNRGNEGQTGLSSPKRYLWDERKSASPWRFNLATVPDGLLIGNFMSKLDEDGSVLSATGLTDGAMSPLFSRSSLFTLFLLEVLLQARSQMNSFAAREGRIEKLLPRRLANLILTLPPAMPIEEVKIVNRRADAAIHLLRDVTGGTGARPCLLEAAAEAMREQRKEVGVEATLDEATATQIVFLYDQIAQVYRGDAQLCFSVAGRPRARDGGPPRASLRIASIDIGGGTTDLAIHTYGLDHNVVVPTEEFREGFRLAGDDVLEHVIMRHVMPALVLALHEAGLGAERARAFVIETFRTPPPTEPERQTRRLLLNHIMAPAALALMGQYEAWDMLSPAPMLGGRLGELLAPGVAALRVEEVRERQAKRGSESAADRAIAWLEERAREAGAHDLKLRDMPIEVDGHALHLTVRQTLSAALDPLCEIIQRLECDTVLLSGRGSRWPAALELVLGAMAVPPHRVHPMHRHHVGAWYPFPDAHGRISDPKTTVAVGAMLQRLLRGGQLDNLAMRVKSGTRSTARYIGKVESNGFMRQDAVYFGNVDLDAEAVEDEERAITFPGSCFIGFRQFAAERWPATRLYRLALAPGVQGIAMPVTVKLRREQPSGNATGRESPLKFKIEGSGVASDNRSVPKSMIVLSLQTMPGDQGSHWMDSGQLETIDSLLGTPARRG